MSLRSSTRSVVFASSGAVVGTTLITAREPDLLLVGAPADATPDVPASVFWALVRKSWVSLSEPFGGFSTTVSGPLAPSPNPLRDQVVGTPVALRRRVGAGVELAEPQRQHRDRQDEQEGGGEQRPRPRSVADHPPPAREGAVLVRVVRIGGLGRRLPVARPRTRLREMARNAGTSVSAESIVTATTIADARPRAPTNGTCDT